MRLHDRAAKPGEEAAILAAEPVQDDAMGLCLRAWADLGTERPIGPGGYGHIPESKCWDWCQRRRLDGESSAIVWAVICALEADRFEREESERKLKGAAS